MIFQVIVAVTCNTGVLRGSDELVTYQEGPCYLALQVYCFQSNLQVVLKKYRDTVQS